MAQQDILRRYLDILTEADSSQQGTADKVATPAPSNEPTTGPGTQIAPPSGSGSIQDVIKAVTAFQKTVGLNPDGILGPKTLAAILSQSGRLGKAELEKLKQASAPTDDASQLAEEQMPMTPPMASMQDTSSTAPAMGETIQDTLRKKSALHHGYSEGLMARSHHGCVHESGGGEHTHWMHGYSAGLKECEGAWGGMAPSMR